MNNEAQLDDEPELILEEEDGTELSTANISLIDDVQLSGNDSDLPDTEDLAAVAKVEQLSDVPDLCFESENEQTRLDCELDDSEAALGESLSLSDIVETPERESESIDSVMENLETDTHNEQETLPPNTQEDVDFLDTLSINHIQSASNEVLPQDKQSKNVSVMPTDNTRLALLESAQLTLNEQLNELVNVLKSKSDDTDSPTQTPSKQFTTAIYYAKHEGNYYLAAKWFRKAALRGHAKAQFYLGMLFCKGDGVPKSFFHAYSWFSLAACQNIEEAIQARKKLEPLLTSYEIQHALRLAADRFEQMADLS